MGILTRALVKAGRWEDDQQTISVSAQPSGFEPGDEGSGDSNGSLPGGRTFPPAPILFPSPKERASRAGLLHGTSSAMAQSGAAGYFLPQSRGAANLGGNRRPVSPHTGDILERCGTITLSPSRVNPAVVVLSGNDFAADEKYQTLAVRLFNLASKKALSTILVTSALEGEGKTTVAANLALVMARTSDRRVLLVDADTKRPSVASTFGIGDPVKGWAELIDGNCEPADAIHRIEPGGLYICADSPPRGDINACSPDGQTTAASVKSGTLAPLPGTGMLASARPEMLLEALEKEFGFIIIDTPPILGFAEAQRLAAVADGTVVVVGAGRTNHGMVSDALKLIPKDRRLGIVLNQAAAEEESTYYGTRTYLTTSRYARKDR
ncbi:MAG TPA: CpsD/CapB family tyrosine-protein kinase [Blastocatellia bacterium]